MSELQEWLTSVWSTHRTELLWLSAVVVFFRLLTEVVERTVAKKWTTKIDQAIATYRLVGLVHHVIQVPVAILVLLDKRMWEDRLFGSTQLSSQMVIISCGYFIHDFIHCVENVKVQGVSYVIHGAGCAAVYLFSLVQTPTMLHFYGAGFLMWEVSSFFVHGRWFMHKGSWAGPGLQLANGLALLLSFFFARIIWGFYLSYLYWTDILACGCATTAFIATTLAANTALNLLNSYWFYLIAGKAVEALSGKKADSLGKRD